MATNNTAVDDDDVPLSLFDKLNVDKDSEDLKQMPTEKDMDKEAFLQFVRDHGPQPGNPHPNYILMDHKEGLLYADPDSEVIRLDHCKFVPIPYHVIPNELQETHVKTAIEEFNNLSQNPLFVSFIIPTPALLIRLSSRPGMRDIQSIYEAKEKLICNFRDLINSPLGENESREDRENERRHILQNYMHLEFQATDYPCERERFENKGWNRYMTTSEAIVQYMRVKKMIEMTHGFAQFDSELKHVMQVYIGKANARLTEGITTLGRSINRYITDDVDDLVTQILRHGEIHDLSGVNPVIIEAACLMFTTGMIRLLEQWILFVAGIAGDERLMDYHCIGNYTENQFLQDYSMQERCARENASVFLRRRGEENENWRSLPETRPNILRTFTQWPAAPTEENLQFPPRMFSKEMCGTLACHLAYARLEDRHSFGMSVRITERARFYLGLNVRLPSGDFDQRQTFWIPGQDDPVPLWKTTTESTVSDDDCLSDDEQNN